MSDPEFRNDYAAGQSDRRPWGDWAVLDAGPGFAVKRIRVIPGGVLSLQRHQHRAEQWTVVAGTARVTRNTETIDLLAGEFDRHRPGRHPPHRQSRQHRHGVHRGADRPRPARGRYRAAGRPLRPALGAVEHRQHRRRRRRRGRAACGGARLRDHVPERRALRRGGARDPRSAPPAVAARRSGVQSCCSSSGTIARPASRLTMATCGTRISRRAIAAVSGLTR